MMTETSKISAAHLGRAAVVFVRQYTPGQVAANTESTVRQYDLRERAVALGWPRAAVRVRPTEQIHLVLGGAGLSRSDERRFGQWEHTSWWDYIRAEGKSEEYKRMLAIGVTRNLVAAKAEAASTRTIGRMAEQFARLGLTPPG
jgi:uncharacterized protein with NAD-binding domain and iron-sulfur cluster